jgi:hypothetical protein
MCVGVILQENKIEKKYSLSLNLIDAYIVYNKHDRY